MMQEPTASVVPSTRRRTHLAPTLSRACAAFIASCCLTACPPTRLEGQPCTTGGEATCEGDTLLTCNGDEWQLTAECSQECVARSGRAGTEHTAAIITQDETWTCVDGPHTVSTAITVAAGATLTLEAGALVKLIPAARIVTDVDGRIQAVGTAGAPILVTSDNGFKGGYGTGLEAGLNVFAVETADNPGALPPSRIEHTILERGTHGLGVFGLSATATPPVVERNAFRDNQGWGIRITCNSEDPVIPDFAATNEFFRNDSGSISACP